MKPYLNFWFVATIVTLPACSSADRTSETVASSTGRLEAAGHACRLAAPVEHVISIVFDNVHFKRDNPDVPSDLEQMPHLLAFLTRNGTVDANHHTPLIAHTAMDILTSLTGLYPDRHGMGVSNSYRFFNPDGSTDPAGSFTYWTDPVNDFISPTPTDHSPTMVGPGGKIAPAPWVAGSLSVTDASPHRREPFAQWTATPMKSALAWSGLVNASFACDEPGPKTVGMSTPMFSSSILAVPTAAKSQPPRVYETSRAVTRDSRRSWDTST